MDTSATLFQRMEQMHGTVQVAIVQKPQHSCTITIWSVTIFSWNWQKLTWIAVQCLVSIRNDDCHLVDVQFIYSAVVVHFDD